MKVTTKGQVTIPLAVREQLGIYPGTEVEFEVEGDTLKVIPTEKPFTYKTSPTNTGDEDGYSRIK